MPIYVGTDPIVRMMYGDTEITRVMVGDQQAYALETMSAGEALLRSFPGWWDARSYVSNTGIANLGTLGAVADATLTDGPATVGDGGCVISGETGYFTVPALASLMPHTGDYHVGAIVKSTGSWMVRGYIYGSVGGVICAAQRGGGEGNLNLYNKTSDTTLGPLTVVNNVKCLVSSSKHMAVAGGTRVHLNATPSPSVDTAYWGTIGDIAGSWYFRCYMGTLYGAFYVDRALTSAELGDIATYYGITL